MDPTTCLPWTLPHGKYCTGSSSIWPERLESERFGEVPVRFRAARGGKSEVCRLWRLRIGETVVTRAVILEIFEAQTENVRALDSAHRQLRRAVNVALRRRDKPAIDLQARLLALVFCTWSESTLSKLIHTPGGFKSEEIQYIKGHENTNSIEERWKRCITLGTKRVSWRGKSNDLPNIRQRLLQIVDDYVVEPSQLRNRLMHGQWVVALNRTTTARNTALTKRLRTLDPVLVEKWFSVHTHLARIVEDMIESPDKAFRRDYGTHVMKLESYLKNSRNWTLDTKTDLLDKKPLRIPQKLAELRPQETERVNDEARLAEGSQLPF